MAGWGDGLSREDFFGSAGILPTSCCCSLSPACGQDARAPRVQDRCGERGSTGARPAERLPEAPNTTPFVLSVAKSKDALAGSQSTNTGRGVMTSSGMRA